MRTKEPPIGVPPANHLGMVPVFDGQISRVVLDGESITDLQSTVRGTFYGHTAPAAVGGFFAADVPDARRGADITYLGVFGADAPSTSPVFGTVDNTSDSGSTAGN